MDDIIKYYENLQTGDIINVFNKRNIFHRLVSWLVNRKSNLKAGHSAIYLFDNLMIEANAMGVKAKKLRTYKKSKYVIYVLRLKNKMDDSIYKNFLESAVINIGNRYAFLQLFALLFKYVFRLTKVPDVSKKSMMCSEYVATTYEYAGIQLFDKKPAEVAPQDYFDCDKLEIIFKSE